MEAETSSPRSVMRLLGIFEVVSQAPGGLTLAELSAALSCPKSSLLTMLRPLVAKAYLLHSGGRYRLGPSIYRFASDVLLLRRFPQIVRSFMEDLAARSGETVFLAAIDRAARVVTYVESIESLQAVRYSVPVGTTRPLYCSAAGLVLLAFQDEAWREDYIDTTPLTPMTPRTVTDRKTLRDRLAEIRHRGVAISVGEAVSGAGGIGAPIVNAEGTVTTAFLIGAPVERFEDKVATFLPMLEEVAGLASSAMGGDSREAAGGLAPRARAAGR